MKQFFPIIIALAGILAVLGVIFVANMSEQAVDPSGGEGSLYLPKQLASAEIEDKAGAQLPLDIQLTDENGRDVRLGDYIQANDERPLIITMLYYGCPRLCSLVLNGQIDVLKKIAPRPGKDYRMLAVSIDERESPELASQKAALYREALQIKPEDKDAWVFHVAKKEESGRLAKALGFNFIYDARDDQFAHGAGLFFVSASGTLVRTLFGIEFTPNDLKLALSEASEGKVGTTFIERVILSCFHYDPDSHRYGVYIMGVMRLGGILTILLLGTFLLIYFRGERKRALMG